MLGFFLAAFGVFLGAGKLEVRSFEHAAANDILSKLQGERKAVNVETHLNGLFGGVGGDIKEVLITAKEFSTQALPLFTEPDRSKRGIVRNLRIELFNFDLKNLHVESLKAAIPDCRYDYGLALSKRQIRLSRSGIGLGTVRIKSDDLAKFILSKYKEIKSVTVTVSNGKAFVEGYGEFALLSTKFLIISTLSSPDGKTLELANARVFFDDRAAEAASARVLLSKLNPVVHLDKDLGLLDAISIKGIRLEQGYIEAWGDTKIPTKPGNGS
ncbi:MAG: hypothetical protein ABL949_07275 [Fimbriimonadaceae bacterium]